MRPTLPIAAILSASLLAVAACDLPDESEWLADTPPPEITAAPTITPVGDLPGVGDLPTVTPLPAFGGEATVTPLPAFGGEATVTPLPTTTAASPGGSPSPTEEDPDFTPGPEDVITLLPYDAIKAILEPRLVDVEWANQQMDDVEQVIGVSIGGEHRAYPIYMLSSHEIVNDVVGGVPIAVTW